VVTSMESRLYLNYGDTVNKGVHDITTRVIFLVLVVVDIIDQEMLLFIRYMPLLRNPALSSLRPASRCRCLSRLSVLRSLVCMMTVTPSASTLSDLMTSAGKLVVFGS